MSEKYSAAPNFSAMIVSGGLPQFSTWVRFAMEDDARLDGLDFDGLVETLPEVLGPVHRAFAESTQRGMGGRDVAVFILAMSFGVTFGFAFLATAVILLPRDKDEFDRV